MGYGSKENPVPWLGPQVWIKEVHWPSNFITVIVDLAYFPEVIDIPSSCGGPTEPLGSGNTLATSYTAAVKFRYPAPPPPPYPPYPPPKTNGGRPARSGDSDPSEVGDPILPDGITFTGMPELPDNGQLSIGAWTVFSTTLRPQEPTGDIMDFRVPGQGGAVNKKNNYRKGTDFKFSIYGTPYTGPLTCYDLGGGVGGFGRRVFDPITNISHFTLNPGTLTIDFGGAEFTYKGKRHSVVARYIAGPYTKTGDDLNSDGSRKLYLLCEAS